MLPKTLRNRNTINLMCQTNPTLLIWCSKRFNVYWFSVLWM